MARARGVRQALNTRARLWTQELTQQKRRYICPPLQHRLHVNERSLPRPSFLQGSRRTAACACAGSGASVRSSPSVVRVLATSAKRAEAFLLGARRADGSFLSSLAMTNVWQRAMGTHETSAALLAPRSLPGPCLCLFPSVAVVYDMRREQGKRKLSSRPLLASSSAYTVDSANIVGGV